MRMSILLFDPCHPPSLFANVKQVWYLTNTVDNYRYLGYRYIYRWKLCIFIYRHCLEVIKTSALLFKGITYSWWSCFNANFSNFMSLIHFCHYFKSLTLARAIGTENGHGNISKTCHDTQCSKNVDHPLNMSSGNNGA